MSITRFFSFISKIDSSLDPNAKFAIPYVIALICIGVYVFKADKKQKKGVS